jgi:hypothetical protein
MPPIPIPSWWLLFWRALPQIGFLKQKGERRRGGREKKKKEGEREEKGRRGASKQPP